MTFLRYSPPKPCTITSSPSTQEPAAVENGRTLVSLVLMLSQSASCVRKIPSNIRKISSLSPHIVKRTEMPFSRPMLMLQPSSNLSMSSRMMKRTSGTQFCLQKHVFPLVDPRRRGFGVLEKVGGVFHVYFAAHVVDNRGTQNAPVAVQFRDFV